MDKLIWAIEHCSDLSPTAIEKIVAALKDTESEFRKEVPIAFGNVGEYRVLYSIPITAKKVFEVRYYVINYQIEEATIYWEIVRF